MHTGAMRRKEAGKYPEMEDGMENGSRMKTIDSKIEFLLNCTHELPTMLPS